MEDKKLLLVKKLMKASREEEDEKLSKELHSAAAKLMIGYSPRYIYDLYNLDTSCPLSDIYCDLYEEVFSNVQD